MRRGAYRLMLSIVVACLLWAAAARGQPGQEATAEPKPAPPEWRIQGLLDALQDPDIHVHGLALETLAELEAASHELVKQHRPEQWALVDQLLERDEPEHLLRALRFIAALGNEGERFLDAVIEHLGHHDAGVRRAVAETLGAQGIEDGRVVDALLERLRIDNDWYMRETAAAALGELGVADDKVVDALLEHLRKAAVDQRVHGGTYSKEQPYSRARRAAVTALGRLGITDDKVVDALLESLHQGNDTFVREAAVRALGWLGTQDERVVDALLGCLRENNSMDVREAAVEALGALGIKDDKVVDALLERLRHDDESGVRSTAAGVLGKLGITDDKVVGALLEQLLDTGLNVSQAAAKALGALGIEDGTAVEALLERLRGDNPWDVRRAAAGVLGALGNKEDKVVDALLGRLRDDNSADVFEAAAGALGRLGIQDERVVDALLERLREDTDRYVRGAAVAALGRLGAKEPKVVEALLEHLREDSENDVRLAAVWALGELGIEDDKVVDALLEQLLDNRTDMSETAAEALGALGIKDDEVVAALLERFREATADGPGWPYANGYTQVLLSLGPFSIESALAILANAELYLPANPEVRLLAYQLSGQQVITGSDVPVAQVVRWLAHPGGLRAPIPQDIPPARQAALLGAFAVAWEHVPEEATELRKDVAERVAELARRDHWQAAHLPRWKTWRTRLQAANMPDQAGEVARRIASLESRDALFTWSRRTLGLLGGHVLFWALLLFAYPRSRQVQAIFFWNPWVRRIAGLGYIGFLLTWVPPLRAALLGPFRARLRADARSRHKELDSYFPDVMVEDAEAPGAPGRPIREVIPELRGQIVLEGTSGLGKTLFLCHLLEHSRRVSVFLPAWRCRQGVLAAIQAMLQGHARDETYLKKLIHSRALDIYIDGVNEVEPDVRAGIVAFAEEFSEANLILTTQPMKWRPPSTARRYRLLPLHEDAVREFLLRRWEHVPRKSCTRDEFETTCRAYLERVYERREAGNQDDDPELAALANPMDATVAAELLAMGIEPDLLALQSQQYNALVALYKERFPNRAFPRDRLAEAAYQMRVNDEHIMPEGFDDELALMEELRMVVARWDEGTDSRHHEFRHDKIQEFFIAWTFSADDERRRQHLGDARFQGVYLLLALMWPHDQAMELREHILRYAVAHTDHHLLDAYVVALERREQAGKRGTR